MKIIDPNLLEAIRDMPCSFCQRAPRSDAAHILGKNMGGSMRLDIIINLIPLCRNCHSLSHYTGHPSTDTLWLKMAIREGILLSWAIEMIYYLRRIDHEEDQARYWLGEARRRYPHYYQNPPGAEGLGDAVQGRAHRLAPGDRVSGDSAREIAF